MAGKKRQKRRFGDRFKTLQIEIVLVFSAILLVVTTFLALVILRLSGEAMQRTASQLIAANSRQLELNINSYLERMETTCTLLFSDEAFYLYDATDESQDEYSRIKSEETIRSRIVDIGLMENYSDFGIVYANDHKVGWISHGTEHLFPEGDFYDTFSNYITNTKKNDGWCFGVRGGTDRMYYVKRLNPNAILVSAFYTRELSSVFIYPEQLEDMTIRLVNQDDVIMFSSDGNEIGEKLPEAITNALKKGNISDDPDYLVNSNVCSNEWRVICSVPKESILRENNRLRNVTLWVTVGMAMIFLLIGWLLYTRLSRPMDGIVNTLQEKADIDSLSGVMNKGAFQEEAESRLAERSDDRLMVFVMLDIDNFKQVNDTLGHAYGDQVIIRVGQLIRRLYERDTIIGRIGGDEFAIFTICQDIEMTEVVNVAKKHMDLVLKEFMKEFAEEHEKCNISISAGIYVTGESGASFQMLYEKADGALYTSKNNGKSRYTLIEGPKEG